MCNSVGFSGICISLSSKGSLRARSPTAVQSIKKPAQGEATWGWHFREKRTDVEATLPCDPLFTNPFAALSKHQPQMSLHTLSMVAPVPRQEQELSGMLS